MKKLLLLGGSRYLLPVIQAAHNLGVYVITCDYLPENIAHNYADEYHNVSITDQEAVLALAKKLKIDGILSFATDPGVVVAAYVAEQLDLPGCPYESVKILQNKDLFRNFLRENGFQTPKAKGFSSVNEISNIIKEFSFPVIIKPVDSAGSKGVTRVDSVIQLIDAVKYALQYSISGKCIVEEFIEQAGSSSDTDCFSVNNRLALASFSCQYFDRNAANPYAPSAYSWPSDMPAKKIAELRAELQRLIQLLNLGTSIYNVETRVGKNGKAYIMEFTPRGGGNRLSEMLRYASGQDLIACNVKGALGLPIEGLCDPDYKGVWAEYILHSNESGVFSHLEMAPSFENEHVIEKDIWVKAGDSIRSFTGANEAIGTFVLRFENQEQMRTAIEEIEKHIKVVLR